MRGAGGFGNSRCGGFSAHRLLSSGAGHICSRYEHSPPLSLQPENLNPRLCTVLVEGIAIVAQGLLSIWVWLEWLEFLPQAAWLLRPGM